jgi:two-component system chemotaxis sensor kinase CheA
MSTREEEFLKRLQATFRLEAEEHLHAMTSGLLALESAAATEPGSEQTALVETIFREAHSLKGAARAVNVLEVESICQALESVLSIWKRGQLTPSPALFDTLNQTVDAISGILAEPNGARADNSPARLIEELQQWEKGESPPPVAVIGSEDSSNEKTTGMLAEPEAEIDSSPQIEPLNHPPTPRVLEDTISLNGSAAIASPRDTLSTNIHESPKVDESPKINEPVVSRVPEKTAAVETVRIATSKLDSLLLQAEELLSVKLTMAHRATDLNEMRAMLDLSQKKWAKDGDKLHLAQKARDTKHQQTQSDSDIEDKNELAQLLDWNRGYLRLLESRLGALSKSFEQDRRTLGGMVDVLLDDMKKVLMMPFSSMLEMFPKLIRDLARSLDKEVQLVMHGGEIEIDRRILEEMKDPLTHLLRNCIDHGLEPSAEREKSGKPRVGTITISVVPRDSSRVEIVVSDDGRGIDAKRVVRSAIEAGHLSVEQAAELSESEALMLIFQSEVSTSAMITDLSGRGLGMAIVREKVENMGGHLTLETVGGAGTTFHIYLPLTLATFRGILVEAASQNFIIPIANVERVLRIARTNVKNVAGHPTVTIDERPVALIQLSDVLEMPTKANQHEWLPVVVLGSADKRVALQVEAVLGEQEVLVKSLGPQLTRVRNIAGATVLGSGRVVPVLNATDMLKSALRAGAISGSHLSETDNNTRQKSILIAEDSITSRMLIKNILEAAGYRVKTTVDGAEAFAALKNESFDLVVSDVEMPHLNGFELAEKIRGDAQLMELPVILVTSLSTREHQERGMDAGANAYIIKSSFDQGNLLDTIRRLI